MSATDRTRLYLIAAQLGAFATALMVLARILAWPDFVQGFAIGVLLGSLMLLFRRKLRDEYIQSFWNAGVSAAFVAMVLWFLFGPFLTVALNGRVADIRPAESSTSWSGPIALVAFFAGFHLRRLRSS